MDSDKTRNSAQRLAARSELIRMLARRMVRDALAERSATPEASPTVPASQPAQPAAPVTEGTPPAGKRSRTRAAGGSGTRPSSG